MTKHIKTLLTAVMLLWGITAYAQYNPSNPAEPGVYYTLTLKCIPEDAGSFNINTTTTQSQGVGVNIRAYTNTGFRFIAWEENGKQVSTDAAYNYTMPGRNSTLVARYEYDPSSPGEPTQPNLPKYTNLDISVSPANSGTLNINSGNRYEIGSSVQLRTYNNNNFSFVNWTQGDEIISTSTSFNYVVKESNLPIVANYTYSPGSPAEPGKPTFQRRLYLETNPENAGYFNINSGNQYTSGSNVTLRAYANKDYVFKNWTKDGTVLSENYTFSYTMPETDVHLVANYEYVYSPGNPGEPSSPDSKGVNIYGMTETIFPGQTINYPVYLRNDQPTYGLIVDILFTDKFTPDLDAIVLSGRCNGHEITYQQVEDGYIRFTVTGDNAFSGDDGKIFDIPITADENITGNLEYPVQFSHGVAILQNGNQIPVVARAGSLSVQYAAEGTLYARYSYDKFQNRVKFTNQSSKEATTFEWDFGDGVKSTEENPLHIYSVPGTYTVKLIVSDGTSATNYEQNVLINDRSTWIANGNFYLGEGANTVRYFSTFDELLEMLGNSRIDGDIIINVESGKTFTSELTNAQVDILRNIYSSLGNSGYTWIFRKDGSQNNPVLSYGNSVPTTFNPEVIELLVNLGKHQQYNGVEVRLWNIAFDASQIPLLANQDVCTGIKTEAVDFSPISTDLQFSWTLSSGAVQGLSGYQTSGSRSIPSMNIVNEGNGDANLEYTVKASYAGKDFTSFKVYMTVHPALVGLFSSLEPRDGTQFENNNITLTWNNIENAVYDVYLWNANNEAGDPIIESTSNLRANISKYCSNGNKYYWQIRAHNNCQEIYSDTLSFQIGSLPDLHVSKLEVGDAVAGKEMTISWTVTNDGIGSTGNVEWSDNVWLVPDVYVGTNSVYLDTQRFHPKLLKTVNNIKALEPGESYNNSVKVQLEERVYGNYWIIVTSDMHDVRNIKWQTVNNAVPNPYTPSVSGSPYPYLYAETTGSYNKVSEANETATSSDNFNYAKIQIAVPGLVDLTVPEVSAVVTNVPGTVTTSMGNIRVEPTPHTTSGLAESMEFYSGKHLIVTATIKNSGALKLERTTFTNVLYISHSPTNENPDDLLAVASKNHTCFLDPDGTTKVSFEVQMPYDWYGETYFYVYADVNDAVYELAAKQNNWGQSAKYDFKLTPGADFLPSDLKTPETIASQTPFTISYNVKNVGPNIPTNSVWTDYFYLSKKDTLDETAVLIGKSNQHGYFSYTVVGNPGGPVLIPAKDYKYYGDNYSVNSTLTVDKVDEGDYYIFVKVDGSELVLEDGGEDNNVLRSGLITCRMPDLQIELVSVECDTIVTSKPVAVTWKIRNNGRGVVKNLKTTDIFYASKNQDGADPVKLGTLENELFINPGEEQILRANITIPQDARLDGVQYIFLRTNTERDILETDYSNNQSAISKTWFQYYQEKPAVIRGTNIGTANIQTPSNARPGESITISYSLTNDGNKKVDSEISQEVYVSNKPDFDGTAVACKITSQQGSSVNLGAEDATKITLSVEIPDNIVGGSKYMHLVLDRQNTLQEAYTKDNFTRWPFEITGNLPQIEVSKLNLPDSIMSSTDVNVSWTVTNTGEWNAGTFKVGVYRSSGGEWNRNDERIASISIPQLAKGASLNQSTKINIPDKYNGKWNIIVKADWEERLVQLDKDNDFASKPVMVQLSPVPDLCVTSLTADETAWSGQKITLKSTFANKGAHKTRQTRWAEDYYLAQSNILNTRTATKIGSRVHNGALEAGAEYKSSISVTIPPNLEGNYMIFAVIDGGDAIYESDENNNHRSIPIFINGKNVCATDLTISNIAAPSHINAGEEFGLSYKITNQGEFQAKGMCREVIYLSSDNLLDADDVMVGTVSGDIDVMPGGTLTRTATGRITNMPEGDYYLIIKTNSTRAIAETDDDNNTAVLASKVKIVFPSISLNGSTSFKTSGYYKLAIPAGFENKTIGFYLNQDKEDNGGLYVSYEKVPTTASYDECSTRPRVEQQEVIISNVKQGNYYILAQDNASVISRDNYAFSLSGSDKIKQVPLTLSTKELQFGATSLSINQGGNGGWLSTNIKGAMLDSIMDFRLVGKGGNIPVEVLHYKNSTSAMATFNLNNVELGQYDVVSELPDGTKATMPNAFSVVPATSVNVEVKLDGPSAFRLNSYAPMSLAYFNNGTNDVELYELMLTIDDGYIADTYENLDKNQQKVLHFRPDYERNSRGFISLPPGERCVLTFFIKTGGNMENNVSVFVVK